MPTPTVSDFLSTHGACTAGAAWAKRSFGPDTTVSQAFEAAKARKRTPSGPQAAWIVWAMTRDGVLSLDQLRRFTLHCAKASLKYTKDQTIHAVVKTVEAYLDGKAWAAASDAARAAVVVHAAWAAAFHATRAAWAARAAFHAADRAAYRAARKDQAAYLLALPNPWGLTA